MPPVLATRPDFIGWSRGAKTLGGGGRGVFAFVGVRLGFFHIVVSRANQRGASS